MNRRIRVPFRFALSATLVLSLASTGPAFAAAPGWTPTGSMATARYYHSATRLPDGRVLVAAGYTVFAGSTASAEIYDPSSGTWSPTGSLGRARYVHTA